jgi:integrase
MATFIKRMGKHGIRWTVRVRKGGQQVTDTFSTKAAAEAWARRQETAIETHEFLPPETKGGQNQILADVIDDFIEHRTAIKRPPGKSFANALERIKKKHGLETLASLDYKFWRQHALERLKGGARSQTVAGELSYVSAILKWGARQDTFGSELKGHASAPSDARKSLKESDGLALVSRERKRRLSDAELGRLVDALKKLESRTTLPLCDLAEFALATAMRRGEIIDLRWDQIDFDNRVARIRRKDPKNPNRIDVVPLLRPSADPKHGRWPRVDPLQIIKRQKQQSERVFPYLGDTLAFWFEKAVAEAKLGNGDDAVHHTVFHTLRHECLSRLADRGLDLLRLALVSGHRDLRHLKRYARPDPTTFAATWGASDKGERKAA